MTRANWNGILPNFLLLVLILVLQASISSAFISSSLPSRTNKPPTTIRFSVTNQALYFAMSIRSLGTGSMRQDGVAELELKAIREEQGGFSENAAETDNDQSLNEQEGTGTEIVYDLEVAKEVARKEKYLQTMASTYSWLPQEQPSEDQNDDGMKPMEIAGPPKELIYQNAPKGGLLLTGVDSFVIDWMYTILIGFLVVSYWRGGWVLFDVLSCHQPAEAGMVNGDSFCYLGSKGVVVDLRHTSAIQALVAGYLFLGVGLTLLNNGLWRPVQLFIKDAPNNLKLHKAGIRVIIVLLLGAGTLCIWRGIWYLLDYYIYPEDALISSYITTFLGAGICLGMCSSASLLAPPAIFLMDGPAHLPPPIGVTIITSYRSIAYPASEARERTQKDPFWFVAMDMLFSYVVLPIGVVGFWRGVWALLDTWLWGITLVQADVNRSILWSFLLGIAALVVASEDMAQHFSPEASLSSPTAITIANGIFGRVRTLILAFGAVNFWRAVWLFWDEFCGNSHLWSPLLSHSLGIVGLLFLGCLSCIAAPPSTLGVDTTAHPESSDEPLFHNVPVPAEALYLLSIARRPDCILQGLELPEIMKDPSVISSPSVRASVLDSAEFQMADKVKSSIDNLLAQDEYMYTTAAQSSTRFEQTAASVQSAARSESSSVLRLSTRHMAKRNKSQFYRSR